MVKLLNDRKVPISKIKANMSKTHSIKSSLSGFCAQDPALKYLAQKAFISYMRSVYLQKNKAVFDVHSLAADKFAASMGLLGAPKIKFAKVGFSFPRYVEHTQLAWNRRDRRKQSWTRTFLMHCVSPRSNLRNPRFARMQTNPAMTRVNQAQKQANRKVRQAESQNELNLRR